MTSYSRQLLTELSHREFEEYTADLPREMDCEARVPPYSADGGIDAIAHRDRSGPSRRSFKVEVKHMTAPHSWPDEQRPVGTLATGQRDPFLTLGSYSSEAIGLQRERRTSVSSATPTPSTSPPALRAATRALADAPPTSPRPRRGEDDEGR